MMRQADRFPITGLARHSKMDRAADGGVVGLRRQSLRNQRPSAVFSGARDAGKVLIGSSPDDGRRLVPVSECSDQGSTSL